MRVHLVDGTYELFRQHFGMASRHSDRGPFDAAAGVVASTLALIEDGATHIGVASDHTIESFRNEMWSGYKTGEGMDPEILDQIPVMERALVAAGFTVWPMVDHEADDALAAAAAVADRDERVEQVLIVTADKDLGQCVRGERVVQFDRRKREIIDADGVKAKFGVGPESIPDYLGLVGDTADGFPGLPGWGAKSAALVLARYGHIEDIPPAAGQWDVPGFAGRPSCQRPCRRSSPTHCCSARSPRSTPTSTSDRSTTGTGTARRTDSPRSLKNSTPRISSPTPTDSAEASPVERSVVPPTEVTTRRSAAHRRCR